jgi:serine/threonine protein kinase
MLKIGSVIDGKYKVLHQIGKGGMSIVYLCINEKANKQWAVKEVRKNGNASSEVIRQNLLTETSILKKLHHPHLPSIIDVIDQDDTYLILMDYVEGRTLKAILDERGALPQEKVVDWAIQLSSTLMYLHRQDPPIIYREMLC